MTREQLNKKVIISSIIFLIFIISIITTTWFEKQRILAYMEENKVITVFDENATHGRYTRYNKDGIVDITVWEKKTIEIKIDFENVTDEQWKTMYEVFNKDNGTDHKRSL